MIFDPQLLERIRAFIVNNNLLQVGQTVIVGCSGGPDSLFLLHLLSALRDEFNLTLIVAHLDHGWRAESARDVEFCKEVAQRLGLEFCSARENTVILKKAMRGSLEELGRMLRRTFFASLIREHNDAVVALGHHSGDQQETFFIRLVRGSSVTGLAGMRARDGRYIHPLLCCTKSEIVATLEANNVPFLVDVTNECDQFLRNRIRMQVIPALRQCDERFDASLARAMDHLRATDDFLTAHTHALFDTCATTTDGATALALAPLLALHPFMQTRVLLHWFIAEGLQFTPSDALFAEVIRFLHNKKSRQHTFYRIWSIIKTSTHLTIIRK